MHIFKNVISSLTSKSISEWYGDGPTYRLSLAPGTLKNSFYSEANKCEVMIGRSVTSEVHFDVNAKTLAVKVL